MTIFNDGSLLARRKDPSTHQEEAWRGIHAKVTSSVGMSKVACFVMDSRIRHTNVLSDCSDVQMSELCDPGCGHGVPSFHEGREHIRALMRSVDHILPVGLTPSA